VDRQHGVFLVDCAGLSDCHPPMPADSTEPFGAPATHKLNGALVRCDERCTGPGLPRVLWAVAKGYAGMWRDQPN